MKIKGYVLENPDKVERAINGSIGRLGQLINGVGEEASDELKLAAYDRLGGLITKEGRKVKTGCFCDLKASKSLGTAVPVENPEVILEFRVDGELVELNADEALPPEVIVAEKVRAKKRQEVLKKVEKKAKK